MKILDLELTNIQSHVGTKFKFSPYLNVVRGLSDSGKSVIVKGLKFLIINRASKKIRNNKTDDRSSVIASDGKVQIGRVKDDKVNGYFIKRESKPDQEFKAISTDVPFEVTKILNLTEVNIQSQKDTFFLIDESPGHIAKELNKVSGLSSIDATLKAINSAITNLTADVRTKNGLIDQSKIKIEETKWTLYADALLFRVENLNEDIDDLESKQKELISLVNTFVQYKNKMNNLLPESIISDFKEISDLDKDILLRSEGIRTLSHCVSSFTNLKKDFEAIELIDLSEISDLQAEIDVLSTDENSLQKLITSYNALAKQYTISQQKLDATLNEISQIEVCPTCNRPMESCDEN